MDDNGENDHEGGAFAVGGSIEPSDSEEEQFFDISLPASHSYMGSDLVTMRGRSVLEAGWIGRIPVVAHHGAVFPGEIVPMLVPDTHDAAIMATAINQDKLFGLLCPDESGGKVSGYGVLCEVFEAGYGDDNLEVPSSLTFKARATHRFRFVKIPKGSVPIHIYARMRMVDVKVLPDIQGREPLRSIRLNSLDPYRSSSGRHDLWIRKMDAALTPWPLHMYDMYDYPRMRKIIKDYFKTIVSEKFPEDAVSLSFWVASNLALSARDRLSLFVVDNALQRLAMEVRYIRTKSVLCCSVCYSEIARREHIFPMSTEGVHSNYTNLGGYMHDIVTVSRALNTELSGLPTAEFSWFPGYTWTIALCVGCNAHIGWRFDAMKRNLRPQQFYGLCRNNVQPRCDRGAHAHEMHAHTHAHA